MVRSAVLLFGMMCVASCGPKGNVAPDRPTENEQIPPVLPTVTVEEELKRLEGEWKLVKAEPGELKQTGRAVFKDVRVRRALALAFVVR